MFFRIKWHKYPAVRVFGFVLAGMLAGMMFFQNIFLLLPVAASAVILSIFFLYNRNISSAFAFLCLSIGLVLSLNLNYTNYKYPDRIIGEMPGVFRGEITRILRADSSKIVCTADGFLDTKCLPEIKTGILLRIYSNENKNRKVYPGSEIFASVYARPPKKKQLVYDFPEEQYLYSLGVSWFARIKHGQFSITPTHNFWEEFIGNIRLKTKKTIEDLFSEEAAPVVQAVLTGDKTALPYETKQKFMLTGTAHILAVSGLHTGITAGIIFLITCYFRSRFLRLILFGLLLASFVIFTGMQPSAVRAGLIAFAMMLSWYLQRKYSMINLIALTALLMLVFNPNLIFSIAFQLSFTAFGGIILLYNPVRITILMFVKPKSGFTEYLISLISVSTAASVSVSALAALYFNVFSFASILWNIIAVPAISLALVYSFISVMLSFFMPLAEIFASAAEFLIQLIFLVNDYALSLGKIFIRGEGAVLTALIISAACVYVFLSKSRKLFFFRLSASLIMCILLMNLMFREDRKMKILPREKTVAVVIPSAKNKTSVIIADRMPKLYPLADYPLAEYITSLDDTLRIGYTGNCGIKTIGSLKGVRFKAVHLDTAFQKTITKKLHLNSFISQINKIK